MPLLLLLFIAVPAAELWLLIQVGGQIGVLPTLLGLVVMGALGAALVKRQGFQVMQRVRSELAAGRMPATELVDGMLVIIAGALMLTPGFFTDIAGFLLLVPPVRALVRRFAWSRLEHRIHVVVPPAAHHQVAHPQIIDVEPLN